MSLGFEMVYLREPLDAIPANAQWKVTARYNVQLGPGRLVRCVRARAHYMGVGLVRHFTEAEFERLFSYLPVQVPEVPAPEDDPFDAAPDAPVRRSQSR